MQKNIVIIPMLLMIVGVLLLSGCTDPEPQNKNPTSSFTIEPSELLQLNDYAFFNSTSIDEDGTITNYTWTINDELVSTDQNIQYQFVENGTYIIKLMIEDNEGAMDSLTQTVFIGSVTDLKALFLGEWNFSGGNQTGQWIFYGHNNTLKSTFTGQYGASTTAYWKFRVNVSEVCFMQPDNDKLTPACYKYEFLDDGNTLKVIDQDFGGEAAYWYRVT